MQNLKDSIGGLAIYRPSWLAGGVPVSAMVCMPLKARSSDPQPKKLDQICAVTLLTARNALQAALRGPTEAITPFQLGSLAL
jgi:hypothetical protein